MSDQEIIQQLKADCEVMRDKLTAIIHLAETTQGEWLSVVAERLPVEMQPYRDIADLAYVSTPHPGTELVERLKKYEDFLEEIAAKSRPHGTDHLGVSCECDHCQLWDSINKLVNAELKKKG